MTTVSVRSVILQDFWVHIGGLIAISIGLFGDRYFQLGLGETPDLMFILGGLLTMGVKIVNGTVAAVTAAAATATAQVVKDTATATAQTVSDTAAATAAATVAAAATAAAGAIPPPKAP